MSRSWTPEEIQVVSKIMKDKGYMSYKEFCEALNNQETKRQYYWNYLEKLRRSGIINMYGAAPYLAEEFGLNLDEAKNILIDWMKNYDPNDYEEEI
jgi:Cdc6-like AAA superfamily ATPase